MLVKIVMIAAILGLSWNCPSKDETTMTEEQIKEFVDSVLNGPSASSTKIVVSKSFYRCLQINQCSTAPDTPRGTATSASSTAVSKWPPPASLSASSTPSKLSRSATSTSRSLSLSHHPTLTNFLNWHRVPVCSRVPPGAWTTRVTITTSPWRRRHTFPDSWRSGGSELRTPTSWSPPTQTAKTTFGELWPLISFIASRPEGGSHNQGNVLANLELVMSNL